jgi:hypothetical protein
MLGRGRAEHLAVAAPHEQANLPAPTFPGTGQKPPKQEPGGRPRVPRG